MKPLGLLSQIGAIGLAIAIIVFFVRPTFAEITETQNDILEYKVARERVTETNSALASRVSQLESVSINDRNRLATYMPVLLDELAVLRDVQIIADNSGINYTIIKSNGQLVDTSDAARLGDTESTLISHEFVVTATGSYDRIKDFLSLLEQNQYPLQVYRLELSAIEAGFLAADFVIVTYTNGSSEI